MTNLKRYICTDCKARFSSRQKRVSHWRNTKCAFGHGNKISMDQAIEEKMASEGLDSEPAEVLIIHVVDKFSLLASHIPTLAALAVLTIYLVFSK